LDKPRLYLDRSEFEAETDNAFMLVKLDTGRGLRARFGDELHQLTEDGGLLRYTTSAVELCMDAETLAVLESKLRHELWDETLFDPEYLAAMIILHRSFAESMPEFPLVTLDAS
jgi:hypothetical protein